MKLLKKENNYLNLLKISFFFYILFIIMSWVIFNFEYFKIISLLNIIVGFLFLFFYIKKKREHIPVPEVIFFTISLGFSLLPSIGLTMEYAEFLSFKGIMMHSQFYENSFNPEFQLKVQFYILIILLSSLLIWEFSLNRFKFKYNFLSYNKNFKINFWKYIFWINIIILIVSNLLGQQSFNFFQNIILIIGNYFFFITNNKFKIYYFIFTIITALLYAVTISFVISIVLIFIVSLKTRDVYIIYFTILFSILCFFLKSEINSFRSVLSSTDSYYLNQNLEEQYIKNLINPKIQTKIINTIIKNKNLEINDEDIEKIILNLNFEINKNNIDKIFQKLKIDREKFENLRIELLKIIEANGNNRLKAKKTYDSAVNQLFNSKLNKNLTSPKSKYQLYLNHYVDRYRGIHQIFILPARFDYSFITSRIFRLKEINGIENSYSNLLPLLSKLKIKQFKNYKENFTNYIGRQLHIFDGIDRSSSLNTTFINSLFYSFDNFALILVPTFLIISSILSLILLKNFEYDYEIFFIIVPLLMWEKNFSLYYGDVIKGSILFLLIFSTKKIIQNIYFFQKYFD